MTRGLLCRLLAVAAAAALFAASAPPPASVAAPGSATVDANLLAATRLAPAPAVLTWDRQETDRAAMRTYLQRAGVDAVVLRGLPMAVACAATRSQVLALAAAPGAISVWGDEPLVPAFQQPSATVAAAPATAGAGAARAARSGATGAGVGIAVVDTGLDGRHPDLSDRVVANVRVLVSHREVLGAGDPPPCQDVYSAELEDSELTSGHGTHLAGVAAGDGRASEGRHRGLAPEADLLGVGMSDTVTPDADVHDGTRLSLLGAVAGLNYALIRGLDGSVNVKAVLAGWVGEGLHDPYHPIALAVRDLYDFGMTVVLPVGNGGPEPGDCSSARTCRFNPYAVGPYAVAVGAATAWDGTLAEFSSRGDPQSRQVRGMTVRYHPDLVAPGVDVVAARRPGAANVATVPGAPSAGGGSITANQTDPRYVAMHGTSVAAAQVAGAVALLQQAARVASGCFLPPRQVREVLRTSASPLPGMQPWEAGAGLLDVDAAIDAAIEAALDGPLAAAREPWMCPGG